MPLLNIEIKRIRDRFSAFGNTSKKGDIDEELNSLWEAINILVEYANTYEGKLYQSTAEHEGEYLYIGEDGKITTKVALMEDLPDFIVGGEQIENESLTADHIQPNSLTGKHFESGTFKNIPIDALQITQEHIAEKAIREINIGEDITNGKIATGAIGKDNLQSKIILPGHISDEGIPLRCLQEFGITNYLKYDTQDLEKTISYFVLDNNEHYSIIIENRGCIKYTAPQDFEYVNNLLPDYILSILPIFRNEEPEPIAILKRDSSYASQNGYQLYSIPGLLDISSDLDDNETTTYCYYYDDYFILPLSNQKFFSEEAQNDVDENGFIELFCLKINATQQINNEEANENIKNFSNSGFVKIYISKNTDAEIIL